MRKFLIWTGISILVLILASVSVSNFQKNEQIKQFKASMASFKPLDFPNLDRYEFEGRLNESLILYTSDNSFDSLNPLQKREQIYPVLSPFEKIFTENWLEKYEVDHDGTFPEVKVVSPDSVTSYASTGILKIDGELYFNEDLIKYRDHDTIATQNNKNSSDNTNNDDAVYRYIMNQFDIVTNYGENYIPEVHDPIVLQKAAAHFSMSVEKVDEIFLRESMSQ